VSERLRVLIVDDEPLARTLLRVLLEREGSVDVVGECSGPEAAAEVGRTRPHVLFLDVQMPGVDGFQVLEQLGEERSPVVVFVTAYDQYAVRAFEVHAVDYLLKPVNEARFRDALTHARARVAGRRSGAQDAGLAALLRDRARYPSRLLVPARGRTLVVEVAAIDWIEATDYTRRSTPARRRTCSARPWRSWSGSSTPRGSSACTAPRSSTWSAVREIRPLFRGDSDLLLTTGARVRLSRTRRAEFQRLFAAAAAPAP
jgi:two-component system LytT family response regulator